MLTSIPSAEQIESMLGSELMKVWNGLTTFVESHYEFTPVWDGGGRYGIREVKYRRKGRTLCTFYVKHGQFTVLVVLGKAERERFELLHTEFSPEIVELYTNTRQYHDGKWLWINVSDESLVEDIKKLIMIKKAPKRNGDLM